MIFMSEIIDGYVEENKNVTDMKILNERYAMGYFDGYAMGYFDGYADCEKDHKIEWETDAWRGGFIFGSFTALLVVILFVMVVRYFGM